MISTRLCVPSVLFLIGIGLGLQQLSPGFGDPATLVLVTQVIGLVGLALIVLEGALGIKLDQRSFREQKHAFTIALGMFAASLAVVTLVLALALDIDTFSAALYATPLSVISSAIAIPSATRFSKSRREFIVGESSFSDIIGVAAFNGLIASGGAVSLFFLFGIAANIAAMAIVGAIVSGGLLYFLFKFFDLHIKFTVFFALLLFLFAIGKALHFPTLALIFVFGLIVNNLPPILNHLRLLMHDSEHATIEERTDTLAANIRLTTAELAFIARTYFFLLFGYVLDLKGLGDPFVLFLGTGIVLALLAIRSLALAAIWKRAPFPEALLMPRGLVTVLLFLNTPSEFTTKAFPDGLIAVVVLASCVLLVFVRESDVDTEGIGMKELRPVTDK